MFAGIRVFLSLLDKREKKWIVFLGLLSAFSGLLEVVAIAVMAQIISFSMGTMNESQSSSDILKIVHLLGYDSFADAFVFIVILVLLLFVSKNIYYLVLDFTTNKYSYYVERKIGRILLSNYLNCPYVFKIGTQTSELLRNVTSECTNITNGFTNPLLSITSNGMMSCFIFGFMIYRDPLLFGILLVIIFLLFYAFQKITKPRIRSLSTKRLSSDKMKNESVMQAFYGFKETKLFRKQNHFIEEYYKGSKISGFSNASINTITRSSRLFLEIGLVFTILIVLTFAIKTNQAKELLVNISIFGVAMFKLLPSLMAVLQSISAISGGKVSLQLIKGEIAKTQKMIEESTPTHQSTEKSIFAFDKSIHVDDVCFAYPNKPEKIVANHISLTINKNETIAFVGESGGGKTTLVDIISGLLTPDSGSVKIDGQNIQGQEKFWWAQIGYIPQQIYLANGSIKENIGFGIAKEHIDSQQIKKVIELANLQDLIHSLEHGVDTEIGENGIQLSGGQRQRIGIARALYHNPSLLIMDEATASLDNISEYEIMKAIDNLTHQKTIIIIAHRLSTIKRCNRILIMENGHIIEEGNYETLSQSSKVLKRMLDPEKESKERVA